MAKQQKRLSGRLWNLYAWRYSSPNWTQPWPCFGKGGLALVIFRGPFQPQLVHDSAIQTQWNWCKFHNLSLPPPFPDSQVWELSTEVCACDKILYVFYRKEDVIRPMAQETNYLLTSGRACVLMCTQRFTELGKFQVLPTEQDKWPVNIAFCFFSPPSLLRVDVLEPG